MSQVPTLPITTSSGAPALSPFPAPVYRDTVLAPIFRDAQRYLLAPLLELHRAHTLMLAKVGILPREEAAHCLGALADLQQPESFAELRSAAYDGSVEDLFFLVEDRLATLLGATVAGKMHTARSRNDIDMTIYRIVLRGLLLDLLDTFSGLRRRLLALASQHAASLMPAYTHNQPAQPTTLGHYLLAYVEVLARDTVRLQQAFARVNLSPLGACAITTTGFPIDRELTARLLGFRGLQLNSYGCIAAVDYLTEPLSVLAVAAVSLGRFVQDLLLWSTAEFNFLRLSAAFVQISSIMPQKRNPVALEHVRILASRSFHDAQSILGNVHNTPFADANDAEDPLQPIAWRAIDEAARALSLLTGILDDAEWNTVRMAAAADTHFLPVTELADTLVRRTDLCFHEAHALVSAVVCELNAAGIGFDPERMTDLIAERLIPFHPCVAPAQDSSIAWSLSANSNQPPLSRSEIRDALRATHFIAVREVPGGPAPSAMAVQLAAARQQLASDEAWTASTRESLAAADRELHRQSDSFSVREHELEPLA